MADNASVETFDESVQDDAVQAHEEDGIQETATPISDFLSQAGEDTDSSVSQEPTQRKENGGIKGRLLDSERKGYSRGKTEAEAAWQAEKAEYQARIQKLEEYEIKEQARELAKQENISEAFAERVIRAERGVPQAQGNAESKPEAQPRDAQGRFVSREQNDANTYANELLKQAETIKRLTGTDMMALYNSDKTVQNRILSREIDFYGLAEEMREQPQQRKGTPPVVKAANGSGYHHRGIADLTDEQFDELDRRLEQGAVFDMRR